MFITSTWWGMWSYNCCVGVIGRYVFEMFVHCLTFSWEQDTCYMSHFNPFYHELFMFSRHRSFGARLAEKWWISEGSGEWKMIKPLRSAIFIMQTWTSKNGNISNRHDKTNWDSLMMRFLLQIVCIEGTWFKTCVYNPQFSPPKPVECFMKNSAPHSILPVVSLLSFLSRLIKCHHNPSQSTNQERIMPSLEIRQWQQGATDCGCSLPHLRLLGKESHSLLGAKIWSETRWIFSQGWK